MRDRRLRIAGERGRRLDLPRLHEGFQPFDARLRLCVDAAAKCQRDHDPGNQLGNEKRPECPPKSAGTQPDRSAQRGRPVEREGITAPFSDTPERTHVIVAARPRKPADGGGAIFGCRAHATSSALPATVSAREAGAPLPMNSAT